MAGIYIHVPYCKQACSYCNFHFSTNLRNKKNLISALMAEIELQRNFYSEKDILSTIYFGGGTPSILEIVELESILLALKKNFTFSADVEVTIECNPDDITLQFAKDLYNIGFNRISLGVQSFVEEDLKYMNRAHNSLESLKSIEILKEAGFYNISCDLIYGSPSLSDAAWEENIKTLIELDIPHISCYALTIESKTLLNKKILDMKAVAPSEERINTQFFIMINKLKEAGYIHYEISNFGKPEFLSRHNQSYWTGEKYLGLGPGAHSFDGESRQWNVSSNGKYIQYLERGAMAFEKEILSEEDKFNEYVMIRMRLKDGINLVDLLNKFGEPLLKDFLKNIETSINQGFVIKNNNQYYLSDSGKIMADGIAASLFV